MFPANITDFPETWANLGEISILFNGWFCWEECENGSCYNVTVLQCYTYVKKFLGNVFPRANGGKRQGVFEKCLDVLGDW